MYSILEKGYLYLQKNIGAIERIHYLPGKGCRHLLTLVFFLLISYTGNAATYYVSNSGNDTNNGLSSSTAWKTVKKVNGFTFSANDIILFKRNDIWNEQLIPSSSGSAGQYISYGTYGSGAKPIISANNYNNTNLTWNDVGGGVYAAKIILGTKWIKNVSEDGIPLVAMKAAAKNGERTDIVGSGQWVQKRSADSVYVKTTTGVSPSSVNIELGTLTGAFTNGTDDLTHSGKDYLIIDGLNLQGGYYPIQLIGSHIIVRNCTVSNCYGDGIKIEGSNPVGNYDNPNGHYPYVLEDIQILNNDVFNFGESGIDNTGGKDVTIKGNEFHDGVPNRGYNTYSYYNNGILFKNNAINCIVEGNKIHDMVVAFGAIAIGGATWGGINDEAVNCKIRYNEIYNISTVPDGSYESPQYIILFDGAKDCEFYNNTITACTINQTNHSQGLIYFDKSNDTKSTYLVEKPIIKNNIFWNNSIYGDLFYTESANGDVDGLISSNNVIQQTNLGTNLNSIEKSTFVGGTTGATDNANLGLSPSISGSDLNFKYKGLIYYSLDVWQHSGYDTGSIKTNPNFTSTTDFRLQSGSPAINAGANLGLMKDILGNPIVGNPDIGAYEFHVPAFNSEFKSICDGSNYQGWTTTGKYTRTLTSNSGKDSIVTTYLTVNPKFTIAEDITINSGENYSGWSTSGTYSRTLNSISGCDSIITTHLAVNTSTIKVCEINQTIQLKKGANMISTYLQATNPDISIITKTIRDSGYLIIMQDETGNSYESWGNFGGWINNLESLQNTEGYKITVANDCSLQITGQQVTMPFDISLKTGWNIISYPRTDVVNAMDVVQTLIDQNKLLKVQDEQGNSIENWQLYGGWKNGIGNLIPGKAYKVKMSADVVLTFQESYPKSAIVAAKPEQTEFYHSSVEGNGTDHMNINITELNTLGLSAGDELAAFDEAVCVATSKITEANVKSGSACLAASFSTDTQKPNGFKVGNSIQIRTWNKLSGDESKVNAEVITGQLKYEKNASVLVKMKSASLATGLSNLNDVVKIDVFPNPCHGKFTVRLSENPEEGSRIDVQDISGRTVASRLITEPSEVFNLGNQPSGLYLVRTTIGANQRNYKLIIN